MLPHSFGEGVEFGRAVVDEDEEGGGCGGCDEVVGVVGVGGEGGHCLLVVSSEWVRGGGW